MTTTSHPGTGLYGSAGLQWAGRGLRAASAVAPGIATRLALRLFFTPLPLKWAARRRPLPASWRVERWPFESASLTAYRHADATPGRPVVLLLHGWGGDASQWIALGDLLVAQGLAPVLLDAPAHGRSDGWRATQPQFSRALFAAQSRLGPLHGVAAHSLGALAAAHAAARGLAVARLALVAPSAPPGPVIGWFVRSLRLAEGFAARMRRAIERREGAALAEFEPHWLGPRIAAPALIVHDEGDRVAPIAAGRALAAALPKARLETTEGLGHRRILGETRVLQTLAKHFDTPLA
jgi:pimeloyl-ACP methyl ester carboxylesterase